MLLGTAMCAAYNVSGTITCDGKGVAGVAVSDGYEIVLTDANGYYAMSSSKLNGYVFYSLPGGYEPMLADGFNPQFWAQLNTPDITVDETHFLGGMDKGRILETLRPHIFFDDQHTHADPASGVVPSAVVPYRVGDDPGKEA